MIYTDLYQQYENVLGKRYIIHHPFNSIDEFVIAENIFTMSGVNLINGAIEDSVITDIEYDLINNIPSYFSFRNHDEDTMLVSHIYLLSERLIPFYPNTIKKFVVLRWLDGNKVLIAEL